MKVENLMTKDVWACKRDDKLQVAAQLMWDHDCGCAPVVDEQRRLVGMITDRDICMAALTQGRRLDEMVVSSAMSWRLVACKPSDPIETIEDQMRVNQIRRVPVVDEQYRLIGLLSLADIAREATREMLLDTRDVMGDNVAATLAALSRPRTNAAAPIMPPSDVPLKSRSRKAAAAR
jgi:CBS-domain-containing membrane protein